jgi:hypothetical protein
MYNVVYMAFLGAVKRMPPRRRRIVQRVEEEGSKYGSGGQTPPPPPHPPQMPDFRQFWQAFMASAPRAVERAPAEGCTPALFLRLHPTKFHGNEGAIAADDWLTSYEGLAETAKCTNE